MIFGNICVCIFDSVFCVFVVYLFLGWYISGAQLSGAQFAIFSGRTIGPRTTGPRGPTVRGPICHFLEADSWAPDNWAPSSFGICGDIFDGLCLHGQCPWRPRQISGMAQMDVAPWCYKWTGGLDISGWDKV